MNKANKKVLTEAEIEHACLMWDRAKRKEWERKQKYKNKIKSLMAKQRKV